MNAVSTRIVRLLTAAVAALALPAVAASPGHAQGDEPTTLTIAVSQEVDTLSPFQAVRLITTNMHRWMYDFLTNYDPQTGETIPALAESWETSADGLTWTYHIRQGTEWSDGQPVTAADVEWAFSARAGQRMYARSPSTAMLTGVPPGVPSRR